MVDKKLSEFTSVDKTNVTDIVVLYNENGNTRNGKLAISALDQSYNSLYLSKIDASSTYVNKTDATETYLSKTDASSTYLSQSDASTSYLSKTDASSTYLSQSDASNTYLTQQNAIATYLTQSSAYSTYLSKTDASSTYLSQTDAADTYVEKDGSNATFAHIVETYSNGTTWYRLWSDGWCEQGGQINVSYSRTTTNVQLRKQYVNTNYSVTLSIGGHPNSGIVQCNWQNKSVSSFDIYGDYTNATASLPTYWEAKGYASDTPPTPPTPTPENPDGGDSSSEPTDTVNSGDSSTNVFDETLNGGDSTEN